MTARPAAALALLLAPSCSASSFPLPPPSPDDLTLDCGSVQLVSPPLATAALDDVAAVVRAAADLARDLWGEARDARSATMWLHRDHATYLAIEEGLTRGELAENRAFSHAKSASAHVEIQPPVTDDLVERIGLPFQTLRLAAHEAAHAHSHLALPDPDLPGWLAEGAASWVEWQAMRAHGGCLPLEEEPWTSTWLVRTQRLLADGDAPAPTAVLRDADALAPNDRYALRFLWFLFLRTERPAELDRVLAVARTTRRGGGYRAAIVRGAEQILLQDESSGDLQAAFAAWVAAFRPRWEELGRSLHPGPQGLVQVAFRTRVALARSLRPIGGDAFALSAELELLHGAEVPWIVSLEEASGTAHLFLVSRDGTRVEHRERAGGMIGEGGWTGQAHAVGGTPAAAGAPLRLELEVRPGGALLRVDGGAPVELPGVDPRGARWGIGVQAGSGGIWRDLAVHDSAGE